VARLLRIQRQEQNVTAREVLGYDIPPDRADASCAACGAGQGGEGIGRGGIRQPIKDDRGVSSLLMLCVDAAACARRYRKGLTAQQFAYQLRADVVLYNLRSYGSGA
jgi:hypothetical protein